MARKENNKAIRQTSVRETPQRYVVNEREICNFVSSLGFTDIRRVAARFQVVADLTSGAFEERIERLEASDLALINKIAGEDDSASYRRLMKAIIASIGQGQNGINAAHLTASRAVEFTFRCTREYFSALHSYRRNLRLGLLDRATRVRHGRNRSRAAGHR